MKSRKLGKFKTYLCVIMLISTILVVFTVPYVSAKDLEDTFTDDDGNDHSVWREIPTNETYYQVYYSNNVSGNNINVGEKITNSTVNETYPQIAIDSTSGFGYILWYNESGQDFCYCGTNEILNKAPENITWGGIRYVDFSDSINATTLNMVAQNYTLNLTWENSTGANYMIIYPDIDGDGFNDSLDHGRIWPLILCGVEEDGVPNIGLNNIARQMYNTLLNHKYTLNSGIIINYTRDDIYFMTHNTSDDADQNGNYSDDVDIKANKTNLINAISSETTDSWFLESKGDGYRVDSDDVVFIYLVDHGGSALNPGSKFYTNYSTEYFISSELNNWLNTMEEKTNVSLTCLVVEACFCGGFIGNTTNGGVSQSNNTITKRVVITSTIKGTNAGMYEDFGDNDPTLNGIFSAPFINSIDLGLSVGDAFKNAEQFSEGYNSNFLHLTITYDHYWNDSAPYPILPQNPKLDDNGDGFGSNGDDLSDTSGEDGVIANSLYLTVPERYDPDEDADNDSDFISFEEVEKIIDNMALRHPYICNLTSIGKSESGNRDIWALKISDNPEIDQDEMQILIVGAIHGDEKMGTEFCIAYIQHLIDNYFVNETITKYVDSKEIFIIPILNPDGYDSNSSTNTNNVDLNRNFWYPGRNLTTDPCFTENETIGFSTFTENHNFSASIFLNGWVSNGTVYYPYGYTTDDPVDLDILNNTAHDVGNILEAQNILRPSPGEADGYSDDWLYHNHSCIAISTEYKNNTLSDFDWQWVQYLDAFEYLTNVSSVSFISPESEEIIGGNYNLSWVVSDNTLKTSNNYSVIIEYGEYDKEWSKNYALTWYQIAELTDENTTSYSWNTTELKDGTYPLRIKLIDNSSDDLLCVDFRLITVSNGNWNTAPDPDRHVKIVYEGKNLLSPSGQDVKKASDLLNPLLHDWLCLTSVGRFDSTTGNVLWRSILANGTQTGDDFELEAGVAYWFNFTDMVREHFDIHFEGPEIEESIPLYLKAGQSNFVGFPYPTNTYTSYDLLDLIPYCTNISKWNPINQTWVTSIKNASGKSGSNFTIELGEGYNVTVDEDIIWPPESPTFIWANKSGNNVRLEWSDGEGIFEIYISNNVNGTGFNFSSPNNTTINKYWEHTGVLSDGNNYSYVVRAKGNSTNSYIAWKFAKQISKLESGNVTWVSLPYYFEINTLGDLAEDIGDSIAWNVTMLDAANQEYKYVVYNTTTSSWEGDTTYEISPGDAVKIYCDTNGTWDIVGSHNTCLELSIIKPGNPNINWLALPFHHTYDTLQDVATDIGDTITWEVRVWSVSNQAYKMVGYNPLFGWTGDTTYSLSEGDAVLVFSKNEGAWQPDANDP